MSLSYFLSDIHIKDNQDLNYTRLNNFFKQQWKDQPGDIYLLGDIFDLWVADHRIFIKRYQELIHQLIEVKKQGFKVVYFEGNHDLHLTKFWQDTLGIEVETEVAHYQIDGLKFRLEHGDLINQADLDYLRLRSFLRNSYMTFLAYFLPGRFWNFIGKNWSQHSRKNSQVYRNDKIKNIVSMIRNHAEKISKIENYDVIISGHMHVKDTFQFESNNEKKLSINLGSWLEEPSVLKFHFKENNLLVDNFEWINLK